MDERMKLGALLDRLQNIRCGQIIGHHGSGKTSLMRSLEKHLLAKGLETERILFTQANAANPLPDTCNDVIYFIDGIEVLAYRRRRELLTRFIKTQTSCVVATHNVWIAWPVSLPLLARLQPTREMVERLFHRLTQKRLTPITLKDALRSFELRRGDLRRVWFDLYHRHEQLSRPERTRAVRVSYGAL